MIPGLHTDILDTIAESKLAALKARPEYAQACAFWPNGWEADTRSMARALGLNYLHLTKENFLTEKDRDVSRRPLTPEGLKDERLSRMIAPEPTARRRVSPSALAEDHESNEAGAGESRRVLRAASLAILANEIGYAKRQS